MARAVLPGGDMAGKSGGRATVAINASNFEPTAIAAARVRLSVLKIHPRLQAR